MIKMGTKKDVNRLRDLAMQQPGAVLKESKGLVLVKIAGHTYLSAMQCRGDWSILCKTVAVGNTIYGWEETHY
jgi:hypothetical protein